MSKSYFGKMPKGLFEWDGLPEGGKFPQGHWEIERSALDTLLAEARAPEKVKP